MSLATIRLFTGPILDSGCFGMLCGFDGVPFAVTLERTFENLRVVIPNGMHKCTKTWFNRGGYLTYEIAVEGHSRVLFHKGNVETDSAGCILVAEKFGLLGHRPAVLMSGGPNGGFTEFWHMVQDRHEFWLDVVGR